MSVTMILERLTTLETDDALTLLREAFGLAELEALEVAARPTRSDFGRDDVGRLLACWATWSRSPGSALAAGRLEDQCQRAAEMLGTSGTQIRKWIVANLDKLEARGAM